MKIASTNIYDHWEIDPKTNRPLFFISIEIIEYESGKKSKKIEKKAKITSSFPIAVLGGYHNIRQYFQEMELEINRDLNQLNIEGYELYEKARIIAQTLLKLPEIENFFLSDELLLNSSPQLGYNGEFISGQYFKSKQQEKYNLANFQYIPFCENYDFFTRLALAQIDPGFNDIMDLDPWFQNVLELVLEQKLTQKKLEIYEEIIDELPQWNQRMFDILKEIGISYYDKTENKIWVVNKNKKLHYVVDFM